MPLQNQQSSERGETHTRRAVLASKLGMTACEYCTGAGCSPCAAPVRIGPALEVCAGQHVLKVAENSHNTTFPQLPAGVRRIVSYLIWWIRSASVDCNTEFSDQPEIFWCILTTIISHSTHPTQSAQVELESVPEQRIYGYQIRVYFRELP